MKTSYIARTGILISIAIILSYVESLIPAFVAIPGVKIGLANIAVVFALYSINFKSAMFVSIARVFISSLFFGSILSLAYSFCGAFASLVVMTLLKKTKIFGITGVSVAGSVMHNIAQIAAASIIMDTTAVFYYIPFLIISAVIAGTVIGIVCNNLIKNVNTEGLL